MKGLGLVLAGGGGKGAYQIGVWKYLREYGIDNYISCVSGTSVGALNAALFAAGDITVAEDVWRNISPSQILSPKRITARQILQCFMGIGLSGTVKVSPFISGIGKGIRASTGLMALDMLAPVWASALSRSYTFSREGLTQVMTDSIDFERIRRNPIPCYATCLRIPDFQVERFDLRSYSSEDVQHILLASSAIPVVFDKVQFKGRYYYDGGLPLVGDNVPIEPVYQSGVKNILVIHLSRDCVIDHTKYPNARIIEIIPRTDLGGPIDGTLDFTSKGAAWRIEQGYQDAVRVFLPFIEMMKIGYANKTQLEYYRRLDTLFNERMRYFQIRDSECMAQRHSDGFDQMCKDLGL